MKDDLGRKELEPDEICITRDRLRQIVWFACQHASKLEAKYKFEGKSGIVRQGEIDEFVDFETQDD